MNLEKFLKLMLENPENITIQYSNINGKEKLLINGEEFKENYDDSKIKEEIADYEEKIEKLDDHLFELVIYRAENRNFDLHQMNKELEFEHYSEEEAKRVSNNIKLMNNLIKEVITDEIESLTNILKEF